MLSKKENKKQNRSKGQTPKVKDYSKEPYFIQSAERAKRIIEKYGLPKELQTGKNS